MKVRIKPWDEAVEAALADDEEQDVWDVNTDDNSIFAITRQAGSWGKIVSGYRAGKIFRADDNFSYPLCVVDKIKPDASELDVLRYGEVITNDQFYTINSEMDRRPVIGDVRIRLITYCGKLYYHKIVDGEVIDYYSVGIADA